MSRIVFDLEASGLLDAENLWCLVTKDLDSKQILKYPPDRLEEGLGSLSSPQILGGHNICGFDIPIIEKLYPGWEYKGKLRDTLCMSKLFEPNRKSHKLETYGIQFGIPKPAHEDWTRYSPEMLHRCTEDVRITDKLYELFVRTELSQWDWIEPLELEQQFAYEQAMQELIGVTIDIEKVHKLIEDIDEKVSQLDEILLTEMPFRIVDRGEVKKPFKKDGTYSRINENWYGIIPN